MDKKEIKMTIIGVVAMLILIISATYAYFGIDSAGGRSNATFLGSQEDVGKYGNSYLRQEIDKMHITARASDMAPGKIGTSYWATTEENERYKSGPSNYVISTAGVVGSETEDIMYKCKSDLIIKTNEEVSDIVQEGDAKVHFGSNITSYGNSMDINPKEIDLKEIVDGQIDGGYKREIEYTIIGNSETSLTTDIELKNKEGDQNALAGKNIEIDIGTENLICSVEKINVLPPSDYDFYINEINAEYTNEETNLIYISYNDNDTESYCITEDETSKDCEWKPVDENHTFSDRYTFKDTTSGEKTIRVFLKDNGGNITDKKEHSIILDTSVPVVNEFKITTKLENYVDSINVKGKVTYGDEYGELDTYCISETNNSNECKWQEITSPTTMEIDIKLPDGEGNKKMYFFIQDKAGNVSKVKESNEVIVDLNKPTITSLTIIGVSVEDQLYTNTENITVKLDYNDSIGVKEYCLMSSNTTEGCDWKPATKEEIPYTLSSGEGEKTIYAFVRDHVNHISDVVSETITLDKKAPSITGLEIKGTAADASQATLFTNTEDVKVKINYSNNDGSEVKEYCLMSSNTTEGCSWKTITSEEIDYTLPSGNGEKTVYAFIRNKVGNISDVFSKKITLDKTKPNLTSLTLTGTAADTTQNTSFTNTENITVKIGYDDASDGYGVYQYCLMSSNTTDGCNWKTATTENIAYTLATGNGAKGVYAFVRDKAGNISSYVEGTTNKSITLDKTKPNLASLTLTGTAADSTQVNSFTNTESITAKISYNDASDGYGVYQYCLMSSNTTDGCSWQAATTGNITYNLATGNGVKGVYAFVRDKAGNISNYVANTTNKSITLDKTKPNLSGLTLTGTAADTTQNTSFTNTEAITIKIGYNDASDGYGVYQYCLMSSNTTDGCSWQTATTENISYTLATGNGVKGVYAFVRDKAGNVSNYVANTTNKSITLDKTKPNLTSLALTGTAADTSQNTSFTNTEAITAKIGYNDASDGYGVYQYCLMASNTTDGCSWKTATTENIAYTLATGNGVKTIYAFVRDKAGNISNYVANTTNKSITLDKTKPNLTSLTLTGTAADSTQVNSFTNTEAITIKVGYNDASDGYGVYQYCLMTSNTTDGCSWKTATTENIAYTLATGNGVKGVYAFVRDKAGNISNYVANTTNKSITLDKTKPNLSGLVLTGTAASTALASTFTRTEAITVKIGYNDASDGYGVYQYCLMSSNTTNGCSWKTATTENITHTLATGDGAKGVFGFVRDKAGNISSYVANTTNKSITLDKTLPVLAAANFTLSSTGPTNVTATIGTVTETNPNQYCFRDGASGNFACQTGKVKSFTVSGTTHTIYAYVQDKAGNVSSTLNKSITTAMTPLQLVAKKPAFLSQTLVGGMYRYQGLATDEINNYICLGNDCNEYGEDMYRIIGITEEGEVKVIKKTALNNYAYRWHVDTSNVVWPNTELFHKLNDDGTDGYKTYETLSFYNNLDKNLKAHIPKHSWSYGETTSSGSAIGDNMYNIENTWPKIDAYISVQYNSDYLYAYTDGKPGTAENIKNSWIHISNNDASNVNGIEWTNEKYACECTGIDYTGYCYRTGNCKAWGLANNGAMAAYALNASILVRPVFYLDSSILITGQGTITSPYKVKDIPSTEAANVVYARKYDPNGYLTKTLYGGMYRYQGLGTDAINNYICLGSSCGENGEDMYRIIGISNAGEMKVVKKLEVNNTTHQWNASAEVGATGWINWPDTTLYHQLNDTGTLPYATTSFYATLNDTLKNYIINYTWKYGKNTSVQYKATFFYELENSWGATFTSPINLLYIHDYLYAYPEGNPETAANLKSTWIHLSNNITSPPSTAEWTNTGRSCDCSAVDHTSYCYRYNNCSSWIVDGNGNITYSVFTNGLVIRPTFYLNTSAKIISGEGTIAKPFRIFN